MTLPISNREPRLTRKEIDKMNEFLRDRQTMHRDELAFKWGFNWAHHLSFAEHLFRQIGVDLPKRTTARPHGPPKKQRGEI